MIDFEIDLSLPRPYCAVKIGNDIHIFENPGKYAPLPHWLRQKLLNGALREVQAPRPVRRAAAQHVADNVIDLAAYRRTGT